MANDNGLRLIAEDQEDLQVIAAAVQDAVLKAENMKYDRRQRRFTFEVNRFRWEAGKDKSRVRSLFAIDSVISVKTRAVTKADPDMVYSILSVDFVPDAEPPGGTVSLLFAGDGEIAISVEALDITLLDSDYEWSTRHRPDHEKRRR